MHTNGFWGRKACATPESVHVPCAIQACAGAYKETREVLAS